jgi:hypothetical protein
VLIRTQSSLQTLTRFCISNGPMMTGDIMKTIAGASRVAERSIGHAAVGDARTRLQIASPPIKGRLT